MAVEHTSCSSHALTAHLDLDGGAFLSQFHARRLGDRGVIERSSIGDARGFSKPAHDLLIVRPLVWPDHQGKEALEPLQGVDGHCQCLRLS